MIERTTNKPNIVKDPKGRYVLVGSIDHGFQIPQDSVLELITSLENTSALMMETPEEFQAQFHPMSTELLVKASVGQVLIEYLSGNRVDEDIGEIVLKYVPEHIAELFVPCVHVRNCYQEGIDISFESTLAFAGVYRGRFSFLDVERTLKNYMRLLQYWEENELDQRDLDHFSYDFEKFLGDVREFELWGPDIRHFRNKHDGKIVVCVGDYHVPFVKSVLDEREVSAPNWRTHLETKREDKLTPQDIGFLQEIYSHIEKALNC
ncbi:hypothetical protein CEE44_03585 [Candidatus Woesearchaeota archaeon B3_Woes]|nr:MAG: hypothetical protein CEE44_03585 [Candidatus Woesearchaeota archaeon B3_Woes]